jgi:tetratricopeptide (TPR) repeat protein
MGETYEKLGHLDLALKYYRKSYKLDNFYDEAAFGIGSCLHQQERWYEAIHFFNKALKLNPDNGGYWIALADAEFKVGNLVSSLEAYEKAALLDPENINVWLMWSFLYYEQGDFPKCLELIKNGLEENPTEPSLYYRSVAYFIAAGKYKEGLAYLENGLILNFEKHQELFEFYPNLQNQKMLLKIIDQYRPEK